MFQVSNNNLFIALGLKIGPTINFRASKKISGLQKYSKLGRGGANSIDMRYIRWDLKLVEPLNMIRAPFMPYLGPPNSISD